MAETLFDGNFRLEHRDASDVPIAQILAKNQKEFGNIAGTEQTDPQKMPKVKKHLSTILKEDDKLVVLMNLDTAATEAGAANALSFLYRIPVTIRNVRTGVVFEKTLGATDFTAKMVSAASKVWAVATWQIAGEYSIPAQTEIKLGHAVQDVRVDSALNLYASYVA